MSNPTMENAKKDSVPGGGGGPSVPGMGGEGVAVGDAVGGGSGPRGGSKLMGQGSLLIVMVAAIAAGTLYLMRVSHAKIAMGNTDKDAAAKIEEALAKLSKPGAISSSDPLNPETMKSIFSNTDAVVEMFSDDRTKRQVPVEYLKKNPFSDEEGRIVEGAADGGGASRPGGTKGETPEQLKVRKLNNEIKELKLETVIQGRMPMAIISGTVVRMGDQLGSFKVGSIGERTVELLAGGDSYMLKMEEAKMTNHPGGKRTR